METHPDSAELSAGARRRAAWAVFAWPLIVTGAALVWTFSFLDDLPETVVTHWGTGGVADGFTSRAAAPWYALIGLVMGWGIGALVLALSRQDHIQRRMGVGIAAGTAALVSATMASTLWLQRGADATVEIAAVDVAITASLVLALLVGVVAGRTVAGAEEAVATGAVPADVPRAALDGTRPTRWSATARPARGVWVLLGLLPPFFVGLAWVTGMWLFPLVTGVLVLAAVVCFSSFRVAVGPDGLVIGGALGVPTWRIPLPDVAYARVTAVDPLWQFGGWGYRLGADGRTGFVVRKGEAVEVTRGDGARWVVTVDGAEEAAALLNSLAERERSTR